MAKKTYRCETALSDHSKLLILVIEWFCHYDVADLDNALHIV